MLLRLSIPKISPESSSPRRNFRRTASSSSTLSEVLRHNPFRSPSQETLPVQDSGGEVSQINKDLNTLADLFPDIKTEVIREVLHRFDGESRLEISAEQLYRYKAEWAKGRYNVPPKETGQSIPIEETFRKHSYVEAVRKTLRLEFRGLSKGAIDAVLAEVNYSYTRARPVLQGLEAKSWRNMFGFFRRKMPQDNLPPSLIRQKSDPANPRLQATGSGELDDELCNLFVRPLQNQRQLTLEKDFELAQAINLQEAETVGALYECQCCYNDVTFENIAPCSRHGHMVCFTCIRRTVQEALFGQGWSKSVDSSRATLHCLAVADECDGVLSTNMIERAILENKAGTEMWSKYQERLATEALQRSQLKLVCCAFCNYAEADLGLSSQAARSLRWRFRRTSTVGSLLATLLLLNFLPLIICILLPLACVLTVPSPDLFYASLAQLTTRDRPTRFRCLKPSCLRCSCIKCHKAWHDPHICHEPLLLSLRTTVEAARTAAVKRTCPRCGTSFVKSSGCNKLTCTCGYSMCYLCRKNIGRTSANDNEATENYRHFCEHFRPIPGRPCTECDKCDLYRSEDEDEVVRQAGQEAERLWRERENMVGVTDHGLEEALNGIGPRSGWWDRVWSGEWTVQGVSDWLVDRLIVIDERSL